MEKLKCPICVKEVYSSVGNGCKMCGMPLEDEKKDFCSDSCKQKYKKINSLN